MGTISGTVKDSSNAFAKRFIRAYRQDTGVLVGTAFSDPSTGAYSITTAYAGEHFVVYHDTPDADVNWANVSCAMHFDGTDGSATYTDEVGHTFSSGGTAPTLTTSTSKFGASCLYLPGSGYLSATQTGTEFNLGTGPFTVEFWLKAVSTSGQVYRGILSLHDTGSGSPLLSFYQQDTSLVVYNAYGGDVASFSAGISTSAFVHIEATLSGGDWLFFANGTQVATAASRTITATRLDIGRAAGLSSNYFNGYIDDIRITKGVSRHTADFTAPAQSFPNGIGVPTENAVILDRIVPV